MAVHRVIVAGGRDFNDYELLSGELNALFWGRDLHDIEIVCGKARGADSLGETYAKEKGIKIAYFPANWATYGIRAGYLRNESMAKYGTALVAFWDGKSKGTKSMIDLAKSHNLKTTVVSYDNRIGESVSASS